MRRAPLTRSRIPSRIRSFRNRKTQPLALRSPPFHKCGTRNILGIGYGFPGYSEQAIVPDTNGAVGPTQFVQFVNDSFVVFNKSNGSVAYGPANGNTLWQALGAPCSSDTNLDEVVQFDKLAKRWVVLMPVFKARINCVWPSPPHRTQPMGMESLHFPLPHNRMPDYPKLAVWPDGYYVTYNQGKYSCSWAQPFAR